MKIVGIVGSTEEEVHNLFNSANKPSIAVRWHVTKRVRSPSYLLKYTCKVDELWVFPSASKHKLMEAASVYAKKTGCLVRICFYSEVEDRVAWALGITPPVRLRKDALLSVAALVDHLGTGNHLGFLLVPSYMQAFGMHAGRGFLYSVNHLNDMREKLTLEDLANAEKRYAALKEREVQKKVTTPASDAAPAAQQLDLETTADASAVVSTTSEDKLSEVVKLDKYYVSFGDGHTLYQELLIPRNADPVQALLDFLDNQALGVAPGKYTLTKLVTQVSVNYKATFTTL